MTVFFILGEGGAKVVRETGEKNKVQELDMIEEGDYFGEGALLSDQLRTASIIATVNDTKCYFMNKADFSKLFVHSLKDIMFAKRQAVTSKEDDDDKTFESKQPLSATTVKCDKTRKLIFRAVKDNDLFSGMAEKGIMKVIEAMWKIEIPKGTSVITQGEMGDNFYVVEKGRFNVYILSRDGVSMHKVDRIAKRDCFGELALLYNTPRNATIVSTTSAVLWAVDRFTYRRLMKNISSMKLRECEGFLKAVPMLRPLSNYERKKVAEALDDLFFNTGQNIVTQENENSRQENIENAMYIISSGEAKVTRQKDGEEYLVRTLGKGDVFGERSLLKNEPRSATVTCLTDVEVLRLDSHAFFLLLEPLVEILQKQVEAYDESDAAGPQAEGAAVATPLQSEATKAVAPVQRRPNNALRGREIHMRNLKIVAKLGRGSFGRVHLVKDVSSGHTYALKTVNKSILTKAKHRAHIISEKNMLVRVTSAWIIALYATFKDANRLYFLLEPCLGGELYTLLKLQSGFDNPTARFYVAAVIMGFTYMHEQEVVYRDLKPENVMLDSQGFPKIVDLGFATELDADGRTYTLCGTPAYLSPEILKGQGYGKGVDWWCLGVFIFELLAGHPPFRSLKHRGNMMKLYERIKKGEYECPKHMSDTAKDMIKNLLRQKPHERLGMKHGGIQNFKKHEWYAGFDWKKMEHRKLRVPIVPYIEEQHDEAVSSTTTAEDTHITPRPYTPGADSWDFDF